MVAATTKLEYQHTPQTPISISTPSNFTMLIEDLSNKLIIVEDILYAIPAIVDKRTV